MVQLEILSGKTAGVKLDARRFPFRIGRAADDHLRLEEDGVWDGHLTLAFDPAAGIVMSAPPAALVAVNGRPCREGILRNGDELELGALKIRFWLGAPRQRSLRAREWLTWAVFVLIAAAQVVLIYRLAP